MGAGGMPAGMNDDPVSANSRLVRCPRYCALALGLLTRPTHLPVFSDQMPDMSDVHADASVEEVD